MLKYKQKQIRISLSLPLIGLSRVLKTKKYFRQ